MGMRGRHWFMVAMVWTAVWIVPRTHEPRVENGKARYFEENHHFDAQAYRGVVRATASHVAVYRRGELKPRASGVIVGHRAVLIAGHSLDARPAHRVRTRLRADELEVRCVADALGDAAALARRSVRAIQFDGGRDGIDMALLEVDGVPFADERIQPLWDGRSRAGDPVVILGHPNGGPLVIADGGHVTWPYRVSSEQLEVLVGDAHRFTRDGVHWTRRREVLGARYPWRKKDQFHRHHPSMFRKQPVLGVSVDAFRGMSGGGCYGKRGGHLLGILIDGMADSTVVAPASWMRFEAVLPSVAIVEALRDAGVDLDALGVCYGSRASK